VYSVWQAVKTPTIIFNNPVLYIPLCTAQSRRNPQFSVKYNIYCIQRYRLHILDELVHHQTSYTVNSKIKVMTCQFDYICFVFFLWDPTLQLILQQNCNSNLIVYFYYYDFYCNINCNGGSHKRKQMYSSWHSCSLSCMRLDDGVIN